MNQKKSCTYTIYSHIFNNYYLFLFSSQESKSGSYTSSASSEDNIINRIHKHPLKFYPEGHPMNELKEIEDDLFAHLKNDNLLPITKRRKILRRLERKKEKIIAQQKDPGIEPVAGPSQLREGSLWDVKDKSQVKPKITSGVIGPKDRTMYTVKDSKIVRLGAKGQEDEGSREYRAVDIVVPINAAEEQLLEGTKMCLDDIKKIDRFKDYEPGIPSKVSILNDTIFYT